MAGAFEGGGEGEGSQEDNLLDLPDLTPEDKALLAGEGGNGTAAREFALFNKGASADDWKRDAARREHDRTQRFRDHFDRMVVSSMWVIVVGFWGLAAVWAINVALGPRAWLEKDQVHALQGLITGGLLLGLLTKHIERRVEDRHQQG